MPDVSNSPMTKSISRNSGTRRISTVPGPASPTSRSPSPSSRSSPDASPRSARASTTAGRSRSPGAGRSSQVFILMIGFTMSELVSAYPTSGGIYWWASKMGGPAAGFFTGWLQPDRPRRRHRVGRLRMRDLHRPHAEHLLRRLGRGLLVLAGVRHLPGGPGAGRVAQHLQRSPDGGAEQHLGVVARLRCVDHRPDPDHRPRPAPELQLRLHRAVQQLRLRRRLHHRIDVLAAGGCLRVPADAVHDHRLRRLRAPLGGDRVGLEGRSEGDLAVDLLLGDRWLDPPAVLRLRDAQTSTGRPTTRASAAAEWRTSSPPRSATTRPRWSC